MFFAGVSGVDRRGNIGEVPEKDHIIEPLLESICDHGSSEFENPNFSSYRFIMLIDPTVVNASVAILRKIVSEDLSRRALLETRQLKVITVGDFAEDRADDARSNVVIEIKNAMAKGETVVLVNSEPIRTNFYDAFNRHVMTYGNDTGEPEYFTNVAVGSLSRPCLIHPNFKIIVVLPLISIRTTPLPFLDRFEKYQLSISQYMHFLCDKKPLPPALKKSLDNINACVTDLFERLHISLSKGRLLFGVGMETLASFALAMHERTFNERGLISLPGGSLVDDDTLLTLGVLVKNIRFRQANLRLFQLAKPEEVYLSRSVPLDYKVHYFLHQEHFSVHRIVESSIHKYHESVSRGQAVRSMKLNIATRTCGFNISDLEVLQRVIDQYCRSSLHFNLEDVSSTEECRRRVADAFADSGTEASSIRHVLLCVVKTSEATVNRLNFLRQEIDSHIPTHNCVVFIILHFSPESMFHAANIYEHLYLDDWDAVQADAFGSGQASHGYVSISEITAYSILTWKRSVKFQALTEDLRTRVLPWLMDACAGAFDESLKRFCDNYIISQSRALLRTTLTETHALYKGPKGSRYPAWKELFDQNAILKNSILQRFIDAWAETNLKRVLDFACILVRGGSERSIVEILQVSLAKTLDAFLVDCARHLLSGCSLEMALKGFKDPQVSNEVHDLVRAVLEGITIPRAHDIFTAEWVSRVSIEVKDSVPRLPFFDRLENCILSEWQDLQKSNTNVNIGNLKERITRGPYGPALQIIDGSMHFLQLALDDYITRIFCPKRPDVRAVITPIIRFLHSDGGFIDLILLRKCHEEVMNLLHVAARILAFVGDLDHLDAFRSLDLHHPDNARSIQTYIYSGLVECLFLSMADLPVSKIRAWRSAVNICRSKAMGGMLDREVNQRLVSITVASLVSEAVDDSEQSLLLIGLLADAWKSDQQAMNADAVLTAVGRAFASLGFDSDALVTSIQLIMEFFLLELPQDGQTLELFMDLCEGSVEFDVFHVRANFCWCLRILEKLYQNDSDLIARVVSRRLHEAQPFIPVLLQISEDSMAAETDYDPPAPNPLSTLMYHLFLDEFRDSSPDYLAQQLHRMEGAHTCLPDVSASMERWSPELSDVFAAIMAGERFPVLPSAQVYWLSSLSGPELVRILKSKRLLQQFGFDSQSEDGPSAALWTGYGALSRAVKMQDEGELGFLLEQGEGDPMFRTRLRMQIPWLLYLEYFKEGISCDLIAGMLLDDTSVLVSSLDLSIKERRPLSILASGPLAADDPKARSPGFNLFVHGLNAGEDGAIQVEIRDLMCSTNGAGLHGPHFVFESLQRIISLSIAGTGLNGYIDNVIPYENLLLREVFSWVLGHYGELRTAYVRHFENRSLEMIASVRDANAHSLNQIRLDFDYLKQKRIADGIESRILDKFMHEVIEVVDIIPMIPKFIKMYKILNAVFGDRLTKDEIRLPILTCLDLVVSRIKIVRAAEFKLNENARFEADIILVDNSTALADLVTESSDSVDAVMRVIESLSSHQNLLEAVAANRDGDDDELWSDAIDANWLPLDTSLFLGGSLTREKWEDIMLSAISYTGTDWTEELDGECKVNWKFIEERIIDSIHGLPKIELSLRTTFRVIDDDFEANQIAGTETFDPIAVLELLVGIIKPSSRLAVPLTAQERVRVEAALKRQSEPKLVAAADTLSTILKTLVVEPKVMTKLEKTSTLYDAIILIGTTARASLTEALPLEMWRLQMKNVKDVAAMLIETVKAQGFLFAWLPVELDQPLSPEAALFLSEKLAVLSSGPTGDLQRSMGSLSGHLLNKVDSLRPRVGAALLRAARAAAHGAREHEWDDGWNELLSDEVRVENLGAFLRFLLKCGSLTASDGESTVYRERVADEDTSQELNAMEVEAEPEQPDEETVAMTIQPGNMESDMIAMREMADRAQPETHNFRIKPYAGSTFLSALLQCLLAIDAVQTRLSLPGDTESPISGPLRRILQESRRATQGAVDPAELMTKLKILDPKYSWRYEMLAFTLFQDLLKLHTGLARLEHCGPVNHMGYFASRVYSGSIGQWLFCMGANVEQVSTPSDTSNEGAYLLFYELGPEDDVVQADEPMVDVQQTGQPSNGPEATAPALDNQPRLDEFVSQWVSVLDEKEAAELAGLEPGTDAAIVDAEELKLPVGVKNVSGLKRQLVQDIMFASRLGGVDPARMRVYRSVSDFMRRHTDPTNGPGGRSSRDRGMASREAWLPEYGADADDPVVVVIPTLRGPAVGRESD
ncbi:hypothetical protein HK405_005543 [Cladochytrium tenue]|nr:hypothetical protein HK405_005543 [Cladochytrium tenue]